MLTSRPQWRRSARTTLAGRGSLHRCLAALGGRGDTAARRRAAHRAAVRSRTRTGPYKHPARVEELRNGDLYLVYYGGEGQYATNTGVFGSRGEQGGRKWTAPIRIAHDPFRSLGNAVVWQAEQVAGLWHSG